jgi:hypothetical protein
MDAGNLKKLGFEWGSNDAKWCKNVMYVIPVRESVGCGVDVDGWNMGYGLVKMGEDG